MNNNPFLSKIYDSQNSRNTQSFFVFKNPTSEADFCLNKCPHEDKECKGTCPEFKNFMKEQILNK